jgi:hypothetical protein
LGSIGLLRRCCGRELCSVAVYQLSELIKQLDFLSVRLVHTRLAQALAPAATVLRKEFFSPIFASTAVHVAPDHPVDAGSHPIPGGSLLAKARSKRLVADYLAQEEHVVVVVETESSPSVGRRIRCGRSRECRFGARHRSRGSRRL